MDNSSHADSAPLVSVVIPNYNYARYLGLRLESVLSQTFQDFEIILLDDASTDNSVEVINGFADNPKVSGIEINRSNTGSPFKQWEKGISMARGKYVWIAEADDLATPYFMESCVGIMENDSKVNVVKSMSRLIDSDGNHLDCNPYTPGYIYDYSKDDGRVSIYPGDEYIAERMLRINGFYNASGVMFRKEAWRKLEDRSYRDFRYAGDWLFWGLLMHGGRVAEIGEKMNIFRIHGKSVTVEGHVFKARLYAEGELVKARLERLVDSILNVDFKRLRSYNYSKLEHKAKYKEVVAELERLEPGFMANHSVRNGYAGKWLWKHFILPLTTTAKIPKAIDALIPITTFPLNFRNFRKS